MLKFLITLCLGLLAYAGPSHAALSNVQGLYVMGLQPHTLTVCTRNDDLNICARLTTLRPDAVGTCSAAVMRNVIAMTKQEQVSDPIPPEGFVTVEDFTLHLVSHRVEVFSGEYVPCRETAKNRFEGTLCADTIMRDGIYAYDHCMAVAGDVFVTPAPDDARPVDVRNVSERQVRVCEHLEDDTKLCFNLSDEAAETAACDAIPVNGWQPFGRLRAFLQAEAAAGRPVYMGAMPCNSVLRTATTCVLQNEGDEDWLLCSTVRPDDIGTE